MTEMRAVKEEKKKEENTATRIPKSKRPNCGLRNERAAADTTRTSEEARDKS